MMFTKSDMKLWNYIFSDPNWFWKNFEHAALFTKHYRYLKREPRQR